MDHGATPARSSRPELAWNGDLVAMFGTERWPATAAVLLPWLRARRWFRGKARREKTIELRDVIPVSNGHVATVIAFVEVTYTEGEPELYSVPLSACGESEAEPLTAASPGAVVARLTSPGSVSRMLLDGAVVPGFSQALLELVAGSGRWRGRGGELVGIPARAFGRLRGSTVETPAATPLGGEQSNSSTVFGSRLILKLYRALERGPNPDLEVSGFLVEHGFPHVPEIAGAVAYRVPGAPAATAAAIGEYVPNRGDLWALTLDAVAAFLDEAVAEGDPPATDLSVAALLERSREPLPARARQLVGAYAETARLLGERTAQMHLALASDPVDPGFAPEPFTPFDQRALHQALRALVGESLGLLARRRDSLPGHAVPAATRVLELGGTIDERLQPLVEHRIGGMRIRIHGDYHLGQVLHTGRDVVIIDFEGEPARPLGERRLKRAALTDVAGMIRSFHYAASAIPAERISQAEAAGADALRRWADCWYGWMTATFLRGYREAAPGAPFLPLDEAGTVILLDALMLSKAAYELRYELNSRPDWVAVPLAGITQLLEG